MKVIIIKAHTIEETKKVLAEDMKSYIKIILEEYKTDIPHERQEFLRGIEDYYSKITVQESGTISMFATNREIIMPKGAYKIFKYLKLIPGYGLNKNHKTFKDGEIINTNTYYDYIKHVILSGKRVEDFFRDSLLHETMHFCGSGGGNAIREGFTELKTRELAQKHELKASRCGYPKEVDIANRFQELVGVDISNKITFAQSNREIDKILRENCGNEIAELFFEIFYLMDKELKAKYDHSKFGGVFGPIKKAKAYSQIDYSKVYERLRIFEETKKQRKQFVNQIKQDNINIVSLLNNELNINQEGKSLDKE